MELLSYRRVPAKHPDWNGFLRLSVVDAAVEHEGHASLGSYSVDGDLLTVRWDRFPADIFVVMPDFLVHQRLLPRLPRPDELFAVKIRNDVLPVTAVGVAVPGSNYRVDLRLRTSDTLTYDQVFVLREYDSAYLPQEAATILDCGANVGLASVFFALKYPMAKIIALEPDAENFYSAVGNTVRLPQQVQCRHAAVWFQDGEINVHRESAAGASLDAWGVQVSERGGANARSVPCLTIGTILDQAGWDRLDILKIDIEGAELEVFRHGADRWLHRVKLIIVETHDRFRPGSEDAVRRALLPAFEELPRSGENLMFRQVA